MSDLNSIFKKIDKYRDECISFQEELTSRTALGPENGGSGEHEKAEYIMKEIKTFRPDSLEVIKAPDDRARDGYRPNIIVRWKGDKPLPPVWILCHMDIVPPGDLSLWDGDPYKIRVEDDKIIGRGVEDNQHGIVSSFLAVKAFRDSGQGLPRDVGLAFVADEETGSKYGLDYILKTRGEIFSPEDLIIVPDAGNEKGTMIEVAEKSMLWIKFTVKGKQCHASTPEKGRNSLFAAARLIIAMEELKRKFNMNDALFSPSISTFEPTKIEANVPNINTIPGKDTLYFDCRILPYYKVDEVIEFSKRIAEEVEKENSVSINLEPVYIQDAVNPTSPDAPVVNALKKAVKKVKGLEAEPMGIGGGTVAAFFRQAGLDAAVWSTAPDTAHQPNEYSLISDILSDAKVFASVFME